jgi:hypothetical protein
VQGSAAHEGVEPLQVTELFIKRRHDAPLLPAATITCSPRGIAKNVPCAPFRQALIASLSVTAELAAICAKTLWSIATIFTVSRPEPW